MKHYQIVMQNATPFGNLPFGNFSPYFEQMINEELIKNILPFGIDLIITI
jgi:hypothetical protein